MLSPALALALRLRRNTGFLSTPCSAARLTSRAFFCSGRAPDFPAFRPRCRCLALVPLLANARRLAEAFPAGLLSAACHCNWLAVLFALMTQGRLRLGRGSAHWLLFGLGILQQRGVDSPRTVRRRSPAPQLSDTRNRLSEAYLTPISAKRVQL